MRMPDNLTNPAKGFFIEGDEAAHRRATQSALSPTSSR